MKFLKRRNKFLSESQIDQQKNPRTIGELIHPRQAEEVEAKWGREFLDLEEIKPTKKIPQVDKILDEEDRMEILSAFFNADMKKMYEMFASLPQRFIKALNESVNLDLLSKQTAIQPEKVVSIMENFDISKPTIDAITILSKSIFRKIEVNKTKDTEKIVFEEGIPKRDENNNIVKEPKDPNEIIYGKNLVNINSFVSDFNDCFPSDSVNSRLFSSGEVGSVINLAAEDFSQGSYDVGYTPFAKQMRLKIVHNPSAILNMSISTYYSSCQHLYTGMYRGKVIGNVFDPNTLPAFIMFDTPIKWKGNVISDTKDSGLPLCRMMIRNLEGFDPNDSKIFFDRCYPDRCKDAMDKIVEKHTGLKSTGGRGDVYYFTPDLPEELAHKIDTPYMDRLGLDTKRYIGVNTKSITLTPNIDWSEVKISKSAKLKEIIIQTTNLPNGLLDIPMKPDWIKFKYLQLKDLSPFSKLESDSYGFIKCEFTNTLLGGLPETTKKLQLTNCKFADLDFSSVKNLEELQLLFTIRKEQLIPYLSNTKLKKLVISTDVANDENLSFLKQMKKSGTTIEFHGPGDERLNKQFESTK